MHCCAQRCSQRFPESVAPDRDPKRAVRSTLQTEPQSCPCVGTAGGGRNRNITVCVHKALRSLQLERRFVLGRITSRAVPRCPRCVVLRHQRAPGTRSPQCHPRDPLCPGALRALGPLSSAKRAPFPKATHTAAPHAPYYSFRYPSHVTFGFIFVLQRLKAEGILFCAPSRTAHSTYPKLRVQGSRTTSPQLQPKDWAHPGHVTPCNLLSGVCMESTSQRPSE